MGWGLGEGGGGGLVLSVISSLLLQVPALVTPGLETANCLVMTSVYSRSNLGIAALLFLCCAVLCYNIVCCNTSHCSTLC